MMKRSSVLVLAVSTAIMPGVAHAAPASCAQNVIENALTAMGGQHLLAGLKSLKLETRSITYRIDDSERHDGPPWLDVITGTETRDEVTVQARIDATDGSAQWVTNVHVFDGDRALVTGAYWNGSWIWNAKPSLGERVALSAEHLLLAAREAPDVHLEARAEITGEEQDVVAFTWKGFPVRVFVDAQTHLPRRMESVRSDPNDGLSTMLGNINWRTDYLFYRREPNGLVYPWQQNSYRDGQPWQTLVITGLQQNPALASDTFELPPDGEKARANAWNKSYSDQQIVVPASGDPLKPVTNNVWQIEGRWNVLIVRQSDGLIVIEAPQSGSYSAKIIDLLASRFHHVPVKAVISTTDTTYHYAGLRTYVARGIPIYALRANAPLLRSFFARPRTYVPDELSRRPRAAIINGVAGLVSVGTGPERIQLYPIRGSGDARMMMAYLPGKHLLYGSSNDLNVDEQRTTFNAFDLVRTVDTLRLPVGDFVAIHTNNIPWLKFRELTLARSPIFGSTAPQPDAGLAKPPT